MTYKYKIIGFNDEIQKYPGPCVRFAESDCFFTDDLPSQEKMRAFATARGYLPRKVKGINQTQCFPVYLYNVRTDEATAL